MAYDLLINNAIVTAQNKVIIEHFTYRFLPGKTYEIIGPNGHGKSTLLAAIMGDYKYQLVDGTITYKTSLNQLSVDQRAKQGIYLLMQNPIAIKGITLLDLIHASQVFLFNNHASVMDTYAQVLEIAKELQLDEHLLERDINVLAVY